MTKYRFKTEEEFIKEFGKNWQNKVKYGWIREMDEFFGKSMKELKAFDYEKEVCIDGWCISRDMITNNKQTVELSFEDRKVTATYGEYSATAQCNKKDEYNKNFGIAIALSRLARKLGEYEVEKWVKCQ